MLGNSTYFRISVTNKCNLSCQFCHREGNHAGQGGELTPEEIQFACKTALKADFKKFKITGGEPTEREDLDKIIALLSELYLPDLSMITNGTNLVSLSQRLWNVGLRRINITVNTLDSQRFQQFRPRNHISVHSITKGIETARRVGFEDMKINFVFFDRDSREDLEILIEFVRRIGVTLVILPVIDSKNSYSLDDMYNIINSYGILAEEIITDNEGLQKRKIYLKGGGVVLLRMEELAEKKPYSFCGQCVNVSQCREGIFPIRLSANGELIPCMADMEHRINVRDKLQNRNEDGMMNAFRKITQWQSWND